MHKRKFGFRIFLNGKKKALKNKNILRIKMKLNMKNYNYIVKSLKVDG